MPDHTGMVAGDESDLHREVEHGNLPRFVSGSRFEQRADDGSPEFDRFYRAATGRVAFG